MKYLMVTNFDAHWDKIKDNRTAYPLGMIQWDISKNIPIENADTIFIKNTNTQEKLRNVGKGKCSNLLERKIISPRFILKFKLIMLSSARNNLLTIWKVGMI